MYILQADWMRVYRDAEAIEEDLPGFKFLGAGWYEEETDTLYIASLGDGSYHVSCWNYPDSVVRDAIATVLDQPVRVKGK